MAYSKVSIPSEVYHFIRKENLDQILADKRIRRFGDTEAGFAGPQRICSATWG